MDFFVLLTYVVYVFVGYFVGRIGDLVGGHWDLPHHWIYGVIFVFIGVTFYFTFIGVLVYYFGIGVFISDFKDFLRARFWGPDTHTDKSVLGFD